MIQIPYGNANFEGIRKEGLIYVDKTKYIELLEQGDDRKKVIYLRPRRFGKSLFTSMLTSYYSVDRKDQFEELFGDLYIGKNPTVNKNNYYVMNFDFSGMAIIGQDIIEEGKNGFNQIVSVCLRSFCNRYSLGIDIKGNMAADMLRNFLEDFRSLNLQHQIYIMVDEYDNFTNAILNGDGQEFLDLVQRNGFVRSFYEVVKTYLGSGVIGRFFATGVMPVTMDNLTSGFNVATNISTDADFSSMIGFTHKEVRELVKKVIDPDIQEKVYRDLEQNYDGYRFSEDNEEKTFNSTLVMYYLNNYVRRNAPPRNIIDMNMNTSGEKIRRTVELVNPKLNYEVIDEVLLNNEISGTLAPVVLDEKYDKNCLITMLFYSGYLTIKEQRTETIFTIPNYVTDTLYGDYLVRFLAENKSYEINTNNISEAIMDFGEYGNIIDLVELVKRYTEKLSNRDTEGFSEKNLKLIFMFFISLSRNYYAADEVPSNQGFIDLMLLKTSSSYSKYEATIELKYVKKSEAKNLDREELVKNSKEQLLRYMQDRRISDREYLKKYVIIFIGLDEYIVEEVL